jgi:hypothetical protein
MPFEKIEDTSTPDAPKGTRSHGGVMNNATDARFDGGRPKAKPGDIMMRGRDGQFVILHRGGVLQIGATELSQRIFIPLDNHMLDISERYTHHNVGGSILWGLSEGRNDTAVKNVETFRIFANDKFADIRISRGVVNPLPTGAPLPDQVIYEVAVSPKGFNADSGDAASSDTSGNMIYQFALDRSGNVSMTIKGDVFMEVKKKLTIKVSDSFSISSDTTGSVTAKNGLDITGGAYTHVKGDLVRLGKGDTPVALKGSFVQTKVQIPVPSTMILTTPVAGVMTVDVPPVPGTPCNVIIQVAAPILSMTSFQADLGGTITGGCNDSVKA